MMIGADCACALAIGTLAALILVGRAAFWVISVVAFVEGAASVVFSLAGTGALKAVVPTRQLPAAVSARTARAFASCGRIRSFARRRFCTRSPTSQFRRCCSSSS